MPGLKLSLGIRTNDVTWDLFGVKGSNSSNNSISVPVQSFFFVPFWMTSSSKIIIFYKEEDAASVPTGACALNCDTERSGPWTTSSQLSMTVFGSFSDRRNTFRFSEVTFLSMPLLLSARSLSGDGCWSLSRVLSLSWASVTSHFQVPVKSAKSLFQSRLPGLQSTGDESL